MAKVLARDVIEDSFALFHEPRRPWLDNEKLRQKFLALSAQVHPDRVHNESAERRSAAQHQYAELNAAYRRLTEPRTRLLHLLELERGARPGDIQHIPADAAELFARVTQVGREADVLLTEKRRLSSPLLQVDLFARSQSCLDQLAEMELALKGRQEQLTTELVTIDSVWMDTQPNSSERKLLLERLEEIYRMLSFFSRWAAQLQQRSLNLSL